MKKIIRTYYSTYVDVELDTNDFENESEMMEHARLNMSDQITKDEIFNNLSYDFIDQDIYDVED